MTKTLVEGVYLHMMHSTLTGKRTSRLGASDRRHVHTLREWAETWLDS